MQAQVSGFLPAKGVSQWAALAERVRRIGASALDRSGIALAAAAVGSAATACALLVVGLLFALSDA